MEQGKDVTKAKAKNVTKTKEILFLGITVVV